MSIRRGRPALPVFLRRPNPFLCVDVCVVCQFDIVEAGLKWVQGKCIVNSISLKVPHSSSFPPPLGPSALPQTKALTWNTAHLSPLPFPPLNLTLALFLCFALPLGG